MLAFVLGFAGCSNCSCTLSAVHVWLVTPAGAPRATTQLDLVASRAELTLEAPVCGQTDPISKGCLEWTCTVTASADATDGSFVLVGTATAVDGTRLPVTVPLTVGNSADTCCGAIYAPVDNTIVVGS